MQLQQTMLSKQQQECLSDGYIRIHCGDETPLEIRRLIEIFWVEHIWWTLDKQETLQQLKQENAMILGQTVN